MSLRIKRGDTLLQDGLAQNDDGTVFDLTGSTVTSQVRTVQGTLVADLDVVITDAPAGEFTLGATATATATWPAGKLLCDVRWESGGDAIHTETFELIVVEAITR